MCLRPGIRMPANGWHGKDEELLIQRLARMEQTAVEESQQKEVEEEKRKPEAEQDLDSRKDQCPERQRAERKRQ
ncbi:hypothetical protein NPX13_g1115 [Xylaria arbuscula]|uniref:Uncharacterized protein n=1 Tax=Xylaria arbuscula TaxID=114810 RepID=A0A9W8TS20_9PEZI|nr:hypothetical protein NPX13_g1115 [Xylaria arbuscula]